jgi:hypothetical protein
VVKDEKPIHDEILDKHDIPEKEIVQFAHEGTKIVYHLNTFSPVE